MRRIKSVRELPLFPLVPFLPAAIFLGSLVASVRALMRVRRLEDRLNATGVF